MGKGPLGGSDFCNRLAFQISGIWTPVSVVLAFAYAALDDSEGARNPPTVPCTGRDSVLSALPSACVLVTSPASPLAVSVYFMQCSIT